MDESIVRLKGIIGSSLLLLHREKHVKVYDRVGVFTSIIPVQHVTSWQHNSTRHLFYKKKSIIHTYYTENDLLWDFHNRQCRLFGHEKDWQSARRVDFFLPWFCTSNKWMGKENRTPRQQRTPIIHSTIFLTTIHSNKYVHYFDCYFHLEKVIELLLYSSSKKDSI